MERIVRLMMCLGLLGLAVLLSSLSVAQNEDTMGIQSVVGRTAPLENTIIAGSAFEFTVTVQYSLASTDNVDLRIVVEEYPKSAGGCNGDQHQSNGGDGFRLDRGSGTHRMPIRWRGDHPAYPGGGYITFAGTYSDGATNHVFRKFGPFKQYCYRFVPAGGQRID
jgi:hypothetical protein